MNEQQEMERWRRRMEFWADVASFFKRSVILDIVCPVLGSAGAGWMLFTRSGSPEAWMACCGMIGFWLVGPVAETIARRIESREQDPPT